jgi:hypothetical protein
MRATGYYAITAFVLAAALIIPAAAPAQSKVKSQKQLDLAAARAERKAAVGENMNLTDAEAKVFWPLYDQYEARMDKIEDRHVREVKNYAASYETLTNDDANRKLDEVVAIQQARLDVIREFVPKFRAALPGIKVTRFFQIDSKLHAMLQCHIAQLVPLAQEPKAEGEGFEGQASTGF